MRISEEEYNELLSDLLETCHKFLPSVDDKLITNAFKYSYESHINDTRASGEPYFYHPVAVAKIVAEEITLDDISVAAALLHDVIEDTEVTYELIKNEFGVTVAEIVEGVTKIGGIFKGHEINQAENYRKLLLSMVRDIRVILVKFADRLHNMRTLHYMRPDKQRRIAKETIEIYAPFASRFGLGNVKWELEDLSFKYLNKEAYNDLARKIKDKREEREKYIADFIKPIQIALEGINLKCEVYGRPKHLYSIYRKMMKRNTVFENIFDLLAIRVIVESTDSNLCYYAVGVINQLYMQVQSKYKDYIAVPKVNNYQSIHNTVINNDGRMIEIQIRTRAMHDISERGVAAHWKYKESTFTSDKEMEEWVNWIRDVFENSSKDDAAKDIISSFQLYLYQEEIYVFTPKGDLLRLPLGATPIDFAYEVHSRIGETCIGAKVNGKIVPLNTELKSGDQVEILTSKNQHPTENWLKFVKTHKAKNNIKKYIKHQDDEIVEHGKHIWEKKIKKLKLTFNDDEVQKLATKLRYDSSRIFFKAIGEMEIDLDKVFAPNQTQQEAKNEFQVDKFTSQVRSEVGGIVIDGAQGFEIYYAKCCNPIPGDEIIGFVTIAKGVTIHRKDCKNISTLSKTTPDRLISVDWRNVRKNEFVAGISIRGEDNTGILKDISNSITNYENTNIHSINIKTEEGFFSGVITVYVKNLEHLEHLIKRLKKINGLFSAERTQLVN